MSERKWEKKKAPQSWRILSTAGPKSTSIKSSLTKNSAIYYSKQTSRNSQNIRTFYACWHLLLSRYSVEFSKPSKQKPIPEGTVKVLFDIIQMDNEEYEIEFSFENESLKHKLDNTMRTNMFQVGSEKFEMAVTNIVNSDLYWLFVSRGSTEYWRINTRLNSSFIWELNSNTPDRSIRKATQLTHSCQSSTSWK